MNDHQRNEIRELMMQYSSGDGLHLTSVPSMSFYRMSAIYKATPVTYNPSICFIVQGEKQLMLSGEKYTYREGEFLAVSLDLPFLGQVTCATATNPYLCLKVDIDPHLLRDLIFRSKKTVEKTGTKRALFVGAIDETLGDCLVRLARLVKTPEDVAIVSPLIYTEIFYRLLNSEHGNAIAQVGVAGSHIQRISVAIEAMKKNLDKTMPVETMAEFANMSPSSFFMQFKKATAMSPLQYHKTLRLQEARRQMLVDNANAETAALRVGYQSTSQFSREYSRMFGRSPKRDTQIMTAVG